MNIHLKNGSTIVFCIFALLGLPGCWDYQKIDMRSSMIGMAVDPAPDDPKQIKVTFQFPEMSQGGGEDGPMAGAEASSTKSYTNLHAVGDSLADIARKMQLQMDRNIDMSDIRCIVFSDQLSQVQLKGITEDLMRDTKVDKLGFLAVSHGTARDVLDADVPSGAPSDALGKKFSINSSQRGYSLSQRLWEFWRDSTRPGVAPLIPVVASKTADADTEGQASGTGVLETGGAEVYQNYKPMLRLSKDETFALNLLDGNVKNMGIQIPLGEGVLTLVEAHDSSHLRCDLSGPKPVMEAHIHVQAVLGRRPSGGPESISPAKLSQLQKEAAAYMQLEMTQTFRKLQEAGTDVFGFSRMYLQGHPEKEQFVKANWNEVFKQAIPRITVDLHISSKGSLI